MILFFIFIFGLISNVFCTDNTNVEITGNKGITLEISYIKPSGREVIPLSPRLSIKIDKLEINGNKRIRGKKPLLWLGSDEEYGKLNSKNTTSAESFETINMHWSLCKENRKYSLEYSSLIDNKPKLFEIPENARNMTLTYRIKYPDNTFSPPYTKKVDLIWNIKDKAEREYSK